MRKNEKPGYAAQCFTLFTKPQEQEVTYFKLSELNEKTKEEFLAAFKTVPDTANYLDLETNDLHLHVDESIEAISHLSAWLTSLDLSFNCLGDELTGNKLPKLVAAVNSNIHFVNLTGNYLGMKSVSQLEAAFKSFHQKLESLNLSFNDFNVQAIDHLVQIAQALPLSLKKLNLIGNDLGEKSTDELVRFFSALSEHKQLRYIDLRENQFEPEQIAAIKGCLPHVKGLYFSDEDFENTETSEFNIGKAFIAEAALGSSEFTYS
ncbi:Ran GTPase-activating protein (RanGAP) involved in mRNA processing and transport [Legionella massiliensis]|uniref:Ran GTPase-activating protein (RanGAP) involved in mRNA processing and transport n=1 Tax=Legionella massiliensis TaxID=1034943 RepID=A0A078L327_9GAMM|nr:hypothetical protein [Legionella massiliensis]CDZ78509.1 Ran GTPase-activating protein (RanGAP) involved in mRNA processing and transport [Legionella massiliensis]CEE14247.1 Leucine Rich Repeat protein [Legionella massiliensis]